MLHTWHKNNFTLSTDKTKLDFDVIYNFLKNSYWAKNTTRDKVALSIKHSLCFGLYAGEHQIGFGRVVSDFTTFAYLGDVFVLPEYRKRGLGKWMIDTIFNECPELKNIAAWFLVTDDAHDLYKRVGFVPYPFPETIMIRTVKSF